MAVLVTLVKQHMDRQPPTVVIQATTWLEAVLALVKIQAVGLGVHLPVQVCTCYRCNSIVMNAHKIIIRQHTCSYMMYNLGMSSGAFWLYQPYIGRVNFHYVYKVEMPSLSFEVPDLSLFLPNHECTL